MTKYLLLWSLLFAVTVLYSLVANGTIRSDKLMIGGTLSLIMTGIVSLFSTPQRPEITLIGTVVRFIVTLVVFSIGNRVLLKKPWLDATQAGTFAALWLTIVMAYW